MSSLLDFAFGVGTSVINNKYAQERGSEDRAENYQYGEMSADNADARQRALIEDFYTPEAQMEHIKAAGLSPSIMYGGSGASGTTGAAQGSGASGIKSDIQFLDPMTMAQIDLIKAQAEKTREEKKTIAGENERGQNEIEKIQNEGILALKEAGAQEAAADLSRSQTALNRVYEMIQKQSAKWQIKQCEYQSKIAYQNAESAYYEKEQKKINLEFDQKTFNDRVELIHKDVEKLAQDILLEKEQVKLTDQQITQLKESISIAWNELGLKTDIYDLDVHKFEQQKFQFVKTMELEAKKLEIGLASDFVSAFAHLLGNVAGAGILSAGR